MTPEQNIQFNEMVRKMSLIYTELTGSELTGKGGILKRLDNIELNIEAINAKIKRVNYITIGAIIGFAICLLVLGYVTFKDFMSVLSFVK